MTKKIAIEPQSNQLEIDKTIVYDKVINDLYSFMLGVNWALENQWKILGKRLKDGYEEEFIIKKDFAQKHDLKIEKLKQVLNSKEKSYKEEGKTLWLFKKEDGEYKEVKRYKGMKKDEGLEIEFENIRKFSEEQGLDKYYVSKILNKRIGYKSFKGWTFERIDQKKTVVHFVQK